MNIPQSGSNDLPIITNFIPEAHMIKAIEGLNEHEARERRLFLNEFVLLFEKRDTKRMQEKKQAFKAKYKPIYGDDLPDGESWSLHMMDLFLLKLKGTTGITGVAQLGTRVQRSIPKGANAIRD